MIYLILFFVVLYIMSSPSKEDECQAYVGPPKFDEAKNTMSEKDFKKFVNENSKKMRNLMKDTVK